MSNRRHQSGAVRFVPALKAVLLCSLLGGSAVGYVLQKNKIYELGQHIGQRQEKLARLRKEQVDLANRHGMMQRPQYLAERVKQLNLGLVQPHPSQVIWLPEPSAQPTLSPAPVVAPPPASPAAPRRATNSIQYVQARR